MHKPTQRQIQRTIFENVAASTSRLMSDEHNFYRGIDSLLPHDVIRHKSEYVRGEVHTQTIESFWSILKRGLTDTYYHVDAGYAFRHNTRHISDAQRFDELMKNVGGRVDWYVGEGASEVEPS